MLRRACAVVSVALFCHAVFAQTSPPVDADTDPQKHAGDVGPLFRGESIPASGTLVFKFENPQLQPARFEITLHADGRGHFVSSVGTAPPTDIADLPPEGLDRDIVVGDESRQHIFAVALKEHGFATKCDSGHSKIAFQGTKTLTFDGPGLRGSCTYNYSSDQKIQWLTTEMLGIAATLEEGRRLVVEHDHGRLTLDAELGTLTAMVKEGDATELINIAPILRTILADDSVIDRARRRAQALLDSDPATAVR